MSTKRALAALILAALLAGCAPGEAAAVADLVDAAQVNAQDPNYTLTSLERRELVREYSTQGNFYFPVDRPLYFEESGRLVSILVTRNQFVEQGTVLAELEYDQAQVRTEISLLEVSIRDQEERYRLAEDSHALALSELDKEYKRQISKYGRDTVSLRREKAEADFALVRAAHQRTLENLDRELAEQRERVGIRQLTAPYDGFVYNVRSTVPGTILEKGAILMQMVDHTVCYLRIRGDKRYFYHGSPVIIDFGRETVGTGVIVSDPDIMTTETSLNFLIRPDEPLLDDPGGLNRTFQVRARLAEVTDVLPARAIKKEDGKEYVSVLLDGVVRRRYVKTGVTNNEDTEILYGLEPGDRVVIN